MKKNKKCLVWNVLINLCAVNSFSPAIIGADGDVDAAAHHITAMFSACNSNPDRPVYHHFTTAIDATSVRVAFHVVVDQIMRGNLEAVQLV